MAKLQENRDKQFELETQTPAKKSKCEAHKDLITDRIGDTVRQLLETLDRIKIVHQT